MSLGGEDTRKQPVDRRRRKLVVTSFAPCQQLTGEADAGNEGKEQRVEIADVKRLKASSLHAVEKSALIITPLVMVQFVVTAPQKRISRDRQQQLAVAMKEAAERAEATDIIVDMLENIEHGDEIETVGIER